MISIIVPFYNRLALLEQTIESVVQQESDGWELILVDDGSNENTKYLKKKYASPQIKFLARKNRKKGAPSCRNIGAENASHNYLMFLDSDDLLAPWSIKSRLQVIKDKPSEKLYIFQGLEFDPINTSDYRLRTLYQTARPLELFLSFQSVWQTSCMVWSKNAFNTIGGWNESAQSWQDGEISVRYLNQFEGVVWGYDYPDVFIRKHSDKNRISNQNSVDKINNLYDTYEQILAELKNEQMRSLFKKNMESMLFTLVEGDIDYVSFRKWIKKRFDKESFLGALLWYLKIYETMPKNSFFKRLLYQLRKMGIPNKRKPFWSIRPQLKETDVESIQTKLKDSRSSLQITQL